MNARVDQILTEALGLPTDERSALVVALLDSIEGSADAGITEVWRDEIRQRRDALKSGLLKPVAWTEARARINSL
jgi:putative addiction module component (TIGR02574 family)